MEINVALPSIINTIDLLIEEDQQMIIQCRLVRVVHYYVLFIILSH